MDECNGDKFRKTFEQQVKKQKSFSIVPVSMIDETKGVTQKKLRIGREFALELHNVDFKCGNSIKENDPCNAVLKPVSSL